VVREGYQQYTIEMDDDDSITGALRAESADALTIVDADGRTHEVKKTRIKERVPARCL